MYRHIPPFIVTLSFLTGCAGEGTGPTGGTKQTVGTVLGAVGGGILGSQIGKGSGKTAAIIGGTVLGGFIGGYIGKGLDDNDKLMAERNAQRSLEGSRTGVKSSWRNPDTDHSGDFIVTRTYVGRDGYHYREYIKSVYVERETRQVRGLARRRSDGTWEVISQKKT